MIFILYVNDYTLLYVLIFNYIVLNIIHNML